MSILDAIRVQRANQKSISDLASLPQNEIIRLAQLGQIPADVVPVVISEKARMAKEMANLRASQQMQQQGGNMPTVIEQAMQANAQAETPQSAMPEQAPMQMPAQGAMPPAMPQGAPQDVGVAALPMGQMFQPQSFESGGIVAFNGEDGSFVESPTGMRVLRSELRPDQISEEDRLYVQTPGGMYVPLSEVNQKQDKDGTGRKPYSLADALVEVQRAYAPYKELTPESQALMEYRKKGILSPGDIEQQKYMRLFQAGLGIMGGTSPYALTNIGTGAQEALKGYAEDIAAQRASKLADLKAAADIAEAKRAEGRAEVGAAAKLYDSYLDRQQRADIAKDSQLGAKYAENYVAMKKAMGDSRPVEVIRDEGYTKYLKEAASENARFERLLATLGSQQNIAEKNIGSREAIAGQKAEEIRDKAKQQARVAALSYWGKLDPIFDQPKKEYNRLIKLGKNEQAEKIKDSVIDKEADRIMKGVAAQSRESTPSATNIPAPRASMELTPEAIAQLRKGEVTTFGNGERWTLNKNGNPVKVP
jgi:hypothetical protein